MLSLHVVFMIVYWGNGPVSARAVSGSPELAARTHVHVVRQSPDRRDTSLTGLTPQKWLSVSGRTDGRRRVQMAAPFRVTDDFDSIRPPPLL
ncbi:hypothetical protein AAFF_G00250850 [Aldrovandia affinis]|uniref:Secreted protein n=1 Tax=Aldrovandia affinis TaxID=143900 RepID=A0AAD7RDD2_9TELE|nr:hypothetical protein AAFF_G00250850 [Aldrovandia affinis]